MAPWSGTPTTLGETIGGAMVTTVVVLGGGVAGLSVAHRWLNGATS